MAFGPSAWSVAAMALEEQPDGRGAGWAGLGGGDQLEDLPHTGSRYKYRSAGQIFPSLLHK